MKLPIFILIIILCVSVVSATQYTEEINQYFLQSTVFIWSPETNVSIEGISISGELEGSGAVQIHLIKGGKQYLIYSRSPQTEVVQVEDYVELAEGTTIGLVVEYGDGKWNPSNDGISPASEGVDFSLSPFFVIPYPDDKLCTLWDVYSVEEKEFTSTCYGSNSCCTYLGFDSRLDSWSEDFVVVYDQAGVSENNLVMARIVFFNETDVAYSNYDGLSARFVQGDVAGSVENLTSLFDTGQNLLRITLDGNTIFYLNSITYQSDSMEDVPKAPDDNNSSVQVLQPYESRVEQTNNSFFVHFPLLQRNTVFEVTNSLALGRVELLPEKTYPNATINITLTSSDGFNQLLDFKTPSDLEMELTFVIPNRILAGDVEKFQATQFDGEWKPLPLKYSHSDGKSAFFKAKVKGIEQITTEIANYAPQEITSEIKIPLPTLPFILIGLTVFIVLGVVIVYGLKKSALREFKISWGELKFKRDMKKIENIRKKFED